MKQQNKAVGVITAILATLLSIAFVLVTFATAVFGSVTSIAQPSNLANVVQTTDIAPMLGEVSEEGTFDLGGVEVPVELVNEVMASEPVQEILSTYTESVSAVLTGKALPEGLTADKLRALADEHLDELVDMVGQHIDLGAPKEEIVTEVKQMINENAEEMVASMPTPEQIVEQMDIPTETLSTMQLVFGPTVITVLIALCVVLALLILVCRLRRFGWMLWIGIDSIIVAVLVAVVGAGSGIALSMLQDQMGQAAGVANSAVGVVTNQLWLAAAILLAVGVAGIVVCCVIRSNAKKKLALAAAAEAALPVEEIAAPAQEAVQTEVVAEAQPAEEVQAPTEE